MGFKRLPAANSDCLEQTGHIVAEAKPTLTGEEDGKNLVTSFIGDTRDLHTFIQISLLEPRHQMISDQVIEVLLVEVVWISLLTPPLKL